MAPFSNRLVSHFDAAIQHYFLNIPVAEGKGVVKPDTVTDAFAREAMPGIPKQEVANRVKSVRLFYIRVKVTIPFSQQTSSCPMVRLECRKCFVSGATVNKKSVNGAGDCNIDSWTSSPKTSGGYRA